VLITMDTVRADHTSLYGYARATTPQLAALAQSATVYSHPVAASNTTLVSHASIFTGFYGSWNGARSVGETQTPISPRYATLAELLGAQGYSTAAIAANSAYLIPYFGFDRGFQVFQVPNALRVLAPEKSYCLRHGARMILDHFLNTSEFDLEFVRSEEINQSAFPLLDRAKSNGRPFFLFVNYMDAHNPYVPPAPFNALFPGHDKTLHHIEELGGMVDRHQIDVKRALGHFISQYDGGIAYVDSQIGALISRLKQQGLYDNTLIVITGDHGEGLGEHGVWGHGVTAYENVVYVPLIVKYPNDTEARRVDEPAGHVDILPTILDFTGTPQPSAAQGRSLRSGTRRNLFTEAFPSTHLIEGRKQDYTARALFSGNFKLIETTKGRRELYDLSADPGETHDVCLADNSRCVAIQVELDQWVRTIPLPLIPGTKLDPRNLQHLKSLGYIGN
jgi:arylsulfatase A-like enzyme